jgi:hypothetical protein
MAADLPSAAFVGRSLCFSQKGVGVPNLNLRVAETGSTGYTGESFNFSGRKAQYVLQIEYQVRKEQYQASSGKRHKTHSARRLSSRTASRPRIGKRPDGLALR